jgi:hydroxymethylglutaryl-CoA lyase
LEVLLREVPAEKLAGHFHDTYGQGVANVLRAYDMGIRTFDSSVAGLGGCPYAPGARGNVSTEDIVYSLEKGGINTGINLDKLIDVGSWISKELGIPYHSRVGAALLGRREATSVSKVKVATLAKDDSKSTREPKKFNKRTWTVEKDTGEYRVSRSGTTVRITLTRPRNGNALTNAMLQGLAELYKKLGRDSTVYHIVLEAQGKYFCTGMDLSGDTDTVTMDSESSYYSKVLALYEAIDHCPKTTISLVDGPCFGGGVGLTFVSDVRFVSPKARWTLSEIKIGVSPAVISKYLVREWGTSMAREGMISGREIGPDELLRIGALHGIVGPNETLDEKLESYLDQLERCAPRSAAINKELTRLGWYEPEGRAQAELIQETFGNMMVSGSEGEHGITMFRKKVKNFSWCEFWGGQNPTEGVKLTVQPRA